MVKNIILSILVVLTAVPWHASGQAGMTLRTSKIISEQETKQTSPLLRGVSAAEPEFGVTLSVSQDINIQDVVKTGAQVGTQLDGVITLRATPSQISKIAGVKGVEFIAADNRARSKLDIATPLVKADSVQRGLGGLSQAYTGKGVIVGIIDFGFNYTHPTFYDSNGNLRITRVWNQADGSGTKPSKFKYGSEYTTQQQMEQKTCSTGEETHGTHVAGIAAGSGGSLKTYKGVAPEANIVMVQLQKGTDSEIIDAISYVFSYAQFVGKPAVVNLSLGSHFGPHDGTSLTDQAIDQLSGAGKIVVGSAGNEGDVKLHTSYCFDSLALDTMRTVVGVSVIKEAVAIAWMEKNVHMEWNMEIWDATTNKRVDRASTSFFSTSSGGGIRDKRFVYNNNRDTITISASGYGSYAGYRRGIVEMEVYNNSTRYKVVVALKSEQAGKRVHLWNNGDRENNEAEFESLKLGRTWVTGNTECTVGEVGGTGNSTVSVGAYVTRSSWQSLQAGRWGTSQVVDSMATFSSLGPTADGRVKPDLVAPGSMLVSSVNRCDGDYGASSRHVVAQETKAPYTYYYAVMQGTSMSAPMTTGAVALLLQQCPSLTPAKVKVAFGKSCTLTPVLSKLPNTTRGAGLLNVLSAVKFQADSNCVVITSAPSILWSGSKSEITFSITPNPNNGAFRIATEESGMLTLDVYNLQGTLMHSGSVQPEQEVSLQYLPRGVYILQLSNGNKRGAQKMWVQR